MKFLGLIVSTALVLFLTACSNKAEPKKKPHFSPEEQQAHSKESLRGL